MNANSRVKPTTAAVVLALFAMLLALTGPGGAGAQESAAPDKADASAS